MPTGAWPAEPERLWADSATVADAAAPRPAPPDVTSTFDRFTARITIEREQLVVGWSCIVVAVVIALLLVFSGGYWGRAAAVGHVEAFFDGGAWYRSLFAWSVPLLLAVGTVVAARSPRSYAAMVRRLYERARDEGIVGRAVDSGHRVPAGDTRLPASYVIDAAVDDRRASRLQWTFSAWFERLAADAAAAKAFNDRFGRYTVLLSEEVFGPEAGGGFVQTDDVADAGSRWRLLVPGTEDRETDPYGLDWKSFVVAPEHAASSD